VRVVAGGPSGCTDAMAISAEAELQESGMVDRNASADCGSLVQLSGTTTLKNCCICVLSIYPPSVIRSMKRLPLACISCQR